MKKDMIKDVVFSKDLNDFEKVERLSSFSDDEIFEELTSIGYPKWMFTKDKVGYMNLEFSGFSNEEKLELYNLETELHKLEESYMLNYSYSPNSQWKEEPEIYKIHQDLERERISDIKKRINEIKNK